MRASEREGDMIAIGSDHGGYDLRQKVMAHLKERGLEYKDFGCRIKVPAIIRFLVRRWQRRWHQGNVTGVL